MAALWEKIQFWKPKMKKFEEDKDFKFVDFKNSDITGIGILAGDFKGVLYHYTGARVKHDTGLPVLEFGYTIVDAGKHDIDLLQKDDGSSASDAGLDILETRYHPIDRRQKH